MSKKIIANESLSGNSLSEVTGSKVGNKFLMDVNASGGLGLSVFDRVDITYPTSTTEVYTFSASAVTTDIITLTYSDSSKETLTTVVKT